MAELKEKIISEIKKIYDPEIPVNIYELGLIYKIEVIENKKALNIYKSGIKIASSLNDEHAKTELSTALLTLELED